MFLLDQKKVNLLKKDFKRKLLIHNVLIEYVKYKEMNLQILFKEL